jgi:hypothetical protein
MSLSSWDDFPVHQITEPVRHVGSSDRNFYDRYYFNLHASSDELFLVLGLGQYPNLAVQDAFAVVRRGPRHVVVRASRELGDRMDTSVGPFRVEVLEPLHRLRVVLAPTEHPLSFDLTWTGAVPAFEEPRHYIRKHGRVLFDTIRFAQTGCWSGTLRIGAETFAVTPDRWKGTRDRSWGVRPVGEPEAPGIRGAEGQMTGMWNYSPMQFDDHAIYYILNETDAGERMLSEAVRVWADPARPPEWLGQPEHTHVLTRGTRMIERSMIAFPHAPRGGFAVEVTPLTHCFITVGTGYGMEPDWRHGMYQGPLVVQGLEYVHDEIAPLGQYGVVDHVARFAYEGRVGFGLHEHGFFGPFRKYGMLDGSAGAT